MFNSGGNKIGGYNYEELYVVKPKATCLITRQASSPFCEG